MPPPRQGDDSGRGGDEVAAEALTGITRNWDTSISSGFVVVTSAQPAEQAKTGAFPKLLGEAVDNLATAGRAPPTLSVSAVVTAMNDSPARPKYQQIGWSSVAMTGELPDFLPNPRHRESLSDIDLYLQQVTEWETQDERREVEYRRRFLVRAMGAQGDEPGWWFTGRHQALTEIADWLRAPDPARAGLVVTGGIAAAGRFRVSSGTDRRRSGSASVETSPSTAVFPEPGPPVTTNPALAGSGFRSQSAISVRAWCRPVNHHPGSSPCAPIARTRNRRRYSTSRRSSCVSHSVTCCRYRSMSDSDSRCRGFGRKSGSSPVIATELQPIC